MKPFLNCRIQYFKHLHLHQLYNGFYKLHKKGYINIDFEKKPGINKKQLLTVIINDKYKVIYDTLDGFNWIDGLLEEKLTYFKNNIDADFYFKRSYSPVLEDYKPKGLLIYPLGFNYSMDPPVHHIYDTKDLFKHCLKNLPLLRRYHSRRTFSSSHFEFPPVMNKENGILFLTRLWNPNSVKRERLKHDRDEINSERISVIRECKKTFGDQFLGGLKIDDYSSNVAPDLLMPSSLTNTVTYLETVKNHEICIATNGLRGSTGFKFGEYIAASRAIISEPLTYQVPGNFTKGVNYLTYSNSEELIQNITNLIEDPELLHSMMVNNYQYYNNYLNPEKLVLNSLLKVHQHI